MKKFISGKLVKILAGVVTSGALIQIGVEPDTAMKASQLIVGQVVGLVN